MVHWYEPWSMSTGNSDEAVLVDRNVVEHVAGRGATPLITWEAWGTIHGVPPARLAMIPTGVFGDYIDQWAREIGAVGSPVFLRPFHEMNKPSYPWAVGQSGNSAADLVRAWQYLHDRFSLLGVTVVVWVWCPNTENEKTSFEEIYPGNQYVDWLGVDGYNGGDQLTWGGWLTPRQLFDRSFASLTRLSADKPIMIAETSAVQEGGDRAQWIADQYGDLPAMYPRVRAIVWFEADTTSRGEADWRIQTSPTSVAAFRSAVSH